MAAEQGDAEAQYAIALIYDLGDGVPEDNVTAVDRYGQGGEQGHGSLLDTFDAAAGAC